MGEGVSQKEQIGINISIRPSFLVGQKKKGKQGSCLVQKRFLRLNFEFDCRGMTGAGIQGRPLMTAHNPRVLEKVADTSVK